MSSTNVPGNGRSANRNSVRQGRRSRRTLPAIAVQLGHDTIELHLSDLSDPETLTTVRQRCVACADKIRFTISDLPRLSDDTRYNLLSTIAGLDGGAEVEIRNHSGSQVFGNLFDAAIAAVESNGDIHRSERSRRAALEAAALLHSDSIEMACNLIARRLRAVGIHGYRIHTLIKEVQALCGKDEGGEELTPIAAAKSFVAYQQDLACASGDQDSDDEPTDDDETDADADMENADAEPMAVVYYCSDFYVYAGTNWRQVKDDQFRAEVTSYLQQGGHGDRITARFLADVITNIKGIAYLRSSDDPMPLWIGDDPDAPLGRSPYLAFANGMINLDEILAGQTDLYRHSPRHFSTVVLPYDFDPESECPLWLETVQQILRPRGNQRQRDGDRRVQVLQEFFGYSLMCGDNRFEQFLVLTGRGANGKSTLMKTWIKLLGRPNVTSVPLDAFGSNFGKQEMGGKLANIAADMNRMDKVAEGVLKAMVSGDQIQIDRKNKSPITMMPTAKLIFGTNNLPPITDRSDGVWRRMIAMPFTERFVGGDCDTRRVERLHGELPGIFNWSIAGGRRLIEQDGFTDCAVCQQTLAEHRHHSDPVAQFIDECAFLYPNVPDAVVSTTDLYKRFKAWCEDNGRKPLGSSEFGKEILAISGVSKRRESTGERRPYYYTGISLSRQTNRCRRRRRRPRRPSAERALGRG